MLVTSRWPFNSERESSTPCRDLAVRLGPSGQSTSFQALTNLAIWPSSAPPGVMRFGGTLLPSQARLIFLLSCS